jgi:hypothetical protein
MRPDIGHTVVEAISGEQALRILRRSEDAIDTVITN